ncbi:hypothetical protein TPHV1_120014 [Treponema phagedenis]|nr:hypothetical protein [Treponema phagedenis]QSH93913.1 hypothetical protein C5O78_02395 [Treponema phagedenis]CEM60885.1 hypothetical protein TPHV1_120014 [Treponema phagedenis]
MNNDFENERLPFDEERLTRYAEYLDKAEEIADVGGTSSLAYHCVGPFLAFLNFDSDVSLEEVEKLLKGNIFFYDDDDDDDDTPYTFPEDPDDRYDEISEICEARITKKTNIYVPGFEENLLPISELFAYSVLSCCDGVYSKSEKRFIKKIFRKAGFNLKFKEKLEKIIDEVCQYEHEIETVKNSSDAETQKSLQLKKLKILQKASID